MDLLIRPRCGRPLAVALLLATAGCAPADSPTAEPDPGGGVGPASAEVVAAPKKLRPDETVLGRRAGSGSTRAALTGTTRDLVYVYGACGGGGEVVAHLVARQTSEVVVPCDGVVSRMQVYGVSGLEFRVKVAADHDQRWAVLVTARDPG